VQSAGLNTCVQFFCAALTRISELGQVGAGGGSTLQKHVNRSKTPATELHLAAASSTAISELGQVRDRIVQLQVTLSKTLGGGHFAWASLTSCVEPGHVGSEDGATLQVQLAFTTPPTAAHLAVASAIVTPLGQSWVEDTHTQVSGSNLLGDGHETLASLTSISEPGHVEAGGTGKAQLQLLEVKVPL